MMISEMSLCSKSAVMMLITLKILYMKMKQQLCCYAQKTFPNFFYHLMPQLTYLIYGYSDITPFALVLEEYSDASLPPAFNCLQWVCFTSFSGICSKNIHQFMPAASSTNCVQPQPVLSESDAETVTNAGGRLTSKNLLQIPVTLVI